MKNVIVVGPDHHNTLGVIRSLGEIGINPIVIVLDEDEKKRAWCGKSKYVKNCRVCDLKEERLLEELLKLETELTGNKYIIPTEDIAVKFINDISTS